MIRADRRTAVLAVLLVTALVGAVCVAGCSGKGRTDKAASSARSKAEKQREPESTLQAEFSKARILWSDAQGRRVMEAQFKEAVGSQTGNNSMLELRTVRASLYKNGKIAGVLTAPSVMADSRKKEIWASGGVTVSSAVENATASADRIVWKAREDRLYGAGSIKMVRENVSVAASSFQADTVLKKSRFTDARLEMK
ncbi:MAG: hypothetical protein NTU88_01950 [Armatimonadetes bacterium]|nr:hypothetical protein [Armatimonadota bacterium]